MSTAGTEEVTEIRDADYEVCAWFERDRKNLSLTAPGSKCVLDLWDEEVDDLIDSGYLTAPRHPRPSQEDWRPHLLAYARHTGLIT